VCLPLLIFPCATKSRSSLLALADPGGTGKMAVKRLWCGGGGVVVRWLTGAIERDRIKFNFTIMNYLLWC